MVMIHELEASSKRNRKRRGRGISAGRGKTAGRGTKGQNARSGGGIRLGFEGGQNPLVSRVPKLPGFTSRRQPTLTLSTSDLNKLTVKTADTKTLSEAGIITHPSQQVKLVAGNQPAKAYDVKLYSASAGAIKLIEQAGGSFVQTPPPKPRKAKPKES